MKKTAPANVLLVEDDFALSDAFSMILTFAGHEVHTAPNGKEALTYLKNATPDIILLDLLMPVMDGREFLDEFDNSHNVPIVVLSNLDSRTQIEDLTQKGAVGYVLKSSITPDTLTALVKQYAAA